METEKNLNYYLSLPYTIEIYPSEQGGYVARVAELPGCITQGETAAEAAAMAEDAKRAWLETALEEGVPIPEPVPEEYSGRLLLRMPKSLHRKLAEKAAKEKVSLNQYIVYRLASAVGD
ncbi:MAG: toxin-antitoxin system HicB family antitoxin [Moorellales bacterium]